MKQEFQKALAKTPIVAVLRNISPNEAEAVGGALIDAGIRLLEVPLNGANALEAVDVLVKNFGDKALIGVGTVMSPDQVKQAAGRGARFALSPHLDADVVKATLANGLASIPGVATSFGGICCP